MATDIRKPPGVTMWRNGACSTTFCSAVRSKASSGNAKPGSKTAPGPRSCLQHPISATLSKSPIRIHALLGIVEDDTSGISASRSQATDTMPEIDAIGSPLALNRAVMNGECHRVALAQRNHFRPRLHTRALFGQYKLSTREIGRRIG